MTASATPPDGTATAAAVGMCAIEAGTAIATAGTATLPGAPGGTEFDIALLRPRFKLRLRKPTPPAAASSPLGRRSMPKTLLPTPPPRAEVASAVAAVVAPLAEPSLSSSRVPISPNATISVSPASLASPLASPGKGSRRPSPPGPFALSSRCSDRIRRMLIQQQRQHSRKKAVVEVIITHAFCMSQQLSSEPSYAVAIKDTVDAMSPFRRYK
mmetsp:Transcript_38652/g.89047  ORF Transcript_38652/g.89047 Transcript_38652/m.89047 type:complete len:213 (+) Transcript_38652:195-833(+)